MDVNQLFSLIQQANAPLMERIDTIADEQVRIRVALQDQDRQLAHLGQAMQTIGQLHTRIEHLEQWKHQIELQRANLTGRLSIILFGGSLFMAVAWEVAKTWLSR